MGYYITESMKTFECKDCIYVQNAYFRCIGGNRNIKPEHVSEIKRAMRAGVVFPAILVERRTRYIIDGQNRYESACQLWREGFDYKLLVHFYDSDHPLQDAIDFNNTQIPWITPDYVNARVEMGNPNYINLKEWVFSKEKLHDGRIPKYEAAAIMLGNKASSIKKGTFEFIDDKLANVIYSELSTFSEILGDNKFFNKSFIKAWMNCRSYCLSRRSFEQYCSHFAERFIKPGCEMMRQLEEAFKNV